MTDMQEKLWHEGVNQTADAVILCGDELLLIQRGDGSWAFPGGFVDEGETTAEASIREAFKETSVIPSVEPWLGYSGRVDDPRNSPRRWIETDAWVYECESKPDIAAGDDAKDARWWKLDTIDALYASHSEILSQILHRREIRQLVETDSHTSEVPVKPGHMGYRYRLFRDTKVGDVFSKSHNPEFFSDEDKASRSRLYLAREHEVMRHMRRFAPHILPNHFELHDHHLIMEGLDSAHGWHWEAPATDTDLRAYIQDCLSMLTSVEATPTTPQHPEIIPSVISFFEEGWPMIGDDELARLSDLLTANQHVLDPDTFGALVNLLRDPESFRLSDITATTIVTNAHHDARQANIAWHPEHGARLVDWSWSGPGTPLSDTTSFLIDLKKSDYDVSEYLKDYFDPDHAKLLIGFWLAHSLLPSRKGNESVRLHQLASAGAAAGLVSDFGVADSPV